MYQMKERKTKMRNLNTLPIETIKKIKEVLKAYDEVNVYFEDGQYHVSTGRCLRATYGQDFKNIGTYKAKDVYTEQERILNYINEFQEYPINYKGERNYKYFHMGKREVFKFDNNGNIVIA
jgi:hypothetical protein